MLSNIVDLSELPLEILEKIVSELTPEEICAKIRHISHRFEEVAYNVMKAAFRAVEPLIESQLENAKKKLQELTVTTNTFQNEMSLVTKFTFLQVMHSEYKILSTIIMESESVTYSTIMFKIVKNIDEFYYLMQCLKSNRWDWSSDNVADVMDKLRSLNSDIYDEFFWKNWDIQKNPFGPLLIKILGCSISSKFEIAVSHASKPKFRDVKCHLSGQYEIPDLSNTLVSPPNGSQNSYHCTRMLAAYVCDSIRWGNLFHTLRLKWLCMVRALALSRRQSSGWLLVDPEDPYLNPVPKVVQEKEIILSNSEKKTCRIIERTGEDTTNVPLWLGMRYDFQLWCPIKNAPKEMFKDGEHEEMLELSEAKSPAPRPYLFKLEFRVYVTAISSLSQGAIETTIWIEETPENIAYTQSRQLVI
ncbi:unnamed protein product [Nezara viridula]|uniref:F-box domain-containing protein n=1 Tax=Nezara viridula TaxID=85310 RepID=A0A9P0HPS1_NEZVI|nr:unnamed protein product [Nezara viridula]